MKVHITQSNFERIVKKLSNIKEMSLAGIVYENKPIYFFSQYEQKTMLAIKEFFQDPQKFFQEVYIPTKEKEDTFWYLFAEKSNPCYHLTPDCERLLSDYKNYRIPGQIKDLGSQAVKEFRKRVIPIVKYLESENLEVFKMRFDLICSSIITKYSNDPDEVYKELNLAAVDGKNRGSVELDNLSAVELEKLIEDKIKEAGRYYYANQKNTTILKRFSKATHLAYVSSSIKDNNTCYSDQEVKVFLKEYNEKVKDPLKKYLIQYYRIKFNPTLSIEVSILEQLNFRQCHSCSNAYEHETAIEVVGAAKAPVAVTF